MTDRAEELSVLGVEILRAERGTSSPARVTWSQLNSVGMVLEELRCVRITTDELELV